MQIDGHDIGICSWSLQPRDMADLVAQMKQLDVQHVQLALGGLLQMDDKRKHQELGVLRSAGLKLTAGMMGFHDEDYSTIARIRQTGGFVSDETWPVRKALMRQAGNLAAELGMTSLTSHIGFIPPSSEPKYNTMVQRVCEIAQPLSAHGITLLMETGQETAAELLQFLNDLRCQNVQVNFDPANMILYGVGEPIDAIETLGRHIGHVHVKDAKLSSRPGEEWGEEVPFGTGEVPPRQFLLALKGAGYTGPLAIEREAGTQRLADVQFAIQTLRSAAAA
ncbi:MAG TPA: sugar phosphate isomerase/epimerase family protein [Tepidisphaeraceae bacterium]|nr:sugar phosphate isomerase/epimerase family protein [Tepidisphaeraceae bacterium]